MLNNPKKYIVLQVEIQNIIGIGLLKILKLLPNLFPILKFSNKLYYYKNLVFAYYHILICEYI